MNCYYHPDRPAVGVCKHCQRGLCAEDAALVADSLACKGRHENEVREMNLMDGAQHSTIETHQLGLQPQCHLLFSGGCGVCGIWVLYNAVYWIAGIVSVDRWFVPVIRGGLEFL